MKDYQKNFLSLALEANALKFGDFTLKSGRKSPYFFNAAAFIEHGALDELAEILVAKVKDSNLNFDLIFGPAYKGIFLGSILATKLSKDKNIPICFNRKEAKENWRLACQVKIKENMELFSKFSFKSIRSSCPRASPDFSPAQTAIFKISNL